MGETATLGALVVQCENEIAIAIGQPERVRELGLWRSILKNWIDFDTTRIPQIGAGAARAIRRAQRTLTPSVPPLGGTTLRQTGRLSSDSAHQARISAPQSTTTARL